MPTITPEQVIARLGAAASPAAPAKYRRYFPERHGEFIGVRMRTVFAIAREAASHLDLDGIERLLEHDAHEVRACGVRVMAEQAKARATTDERRQELAARYLRRYDRIDDWDLVDLGGWEVLGRSLIERPRDVLDRLAGSADPWERRSAITATFAFLRRGELDDTYRLAERLLHDPHGLVQKAVGWAPRNAGDHDPDRLLAYLERRAATMPRAALRAALEKVPAERRAALLALGPTH